MKRAERAVHRAAYDATFFNRKSPTGDSSGARRLKHGSGFDEPDIKVCREGATSPAARRARPHNAPVPAQGPWSKQAPSSPTEADVPDAEGLRRGSPGIFHPASSPPPPPHEAHSAGSTSAHANLPAHQRGKHVHSPHSPKMAAEYRDPILGAGVETVLDRASSPPLLSSTPAGPSWLQGKGRKAGSKSGGGSGGGGGSSGGSSSHDRIHGDSYQDQTMLGASGKKVRGYDAHKRLGSVGVAHSMRHQAGPGPSSAAAAPVPSWLA